MSTATGQTLDNSPTPVGVGSGTLVRQLTNFQARVLGNMREGVWYGDIAEDGIEPWPDWIFTRSTQPNVTLACLIDAGAIEKRMHTYPNGTKWRVFRRMQNSESATPRSISDRATDTP